MWKNDLQLDKYQYARTNPFVVRGLGLLGLISTAIMAYGFWQFLQTRNLYLLIFGPIVSVFIVNKLLRYFLQLFFQKFDIGKHERFIKDYWSKNAEPSVDIFLPYAGEDLAVHREVVHAVSKLDYKNYTVYMLDDVGSQDHEQLARDYGFVYLSRPNKGEHKKSGNLEYGYAHANGDYVLILDADFIPIRDALRDLVPYIASDPTIGILQTPQFFEQTRDVHTRSKIEFGGGNIVEDFYRIVMPCREEFKAAMCVGTSALYRKTAIDRLEGTPKVHASEDLATGLLVTKFGYYVKYLPLIVSMGKSPETFEGYFKQHLRWCSGTLVFAKYWPQAKLSLPARLVYIVNPMHYLSEASTVLFSFQFLILLFFHSETLTIVNSLYFLPYVMLTRVISPLFKANKSKVGTKLAAINNSYTYFYTYLRMMIKGVPSWQPTGVKTTGLHRDFVRSFNLGSAISCFYILCFIAILLLKPMILGNYHTYVVLGWSFYSVFWHALYLTFVATYIYKFRRNTVRSFFRKSYLHLQTYSVLIFFSMLTGTAMFSGYVALSDPRAPTILAIQSIRSRQSATPVAAIPRQLVMVPTATPAPAVLAATSEIRGEVVYAFTVENGDTMIRLAKQAVRLYAIEQHVSLSPAETDNIATTLTLMRGKTLPKAGSLVTFRSSTIEAAILGIETN